MGTVIQFSTHRTRSNEFLRGAPPPCLVCPEIEECSTLCDLMRDWAALNPGQASERKPPAHHEKEEYPCVACPELGECKVLCQVAIRDWARRQQVEG